jgi:UDP-N-acetylmuramyl pentapeptide synthase
MAEADTYVFEDPEDFEKVAELLSLLMAPKDVLLVKASRGLKAERIIEALKKRIK